MTRPVALIVDGHNMIHRGFWAVKEPLTAHDGTPTNAIKGMINILLAEIRKVDAQYCAVVFDRSGKNFRHEIYPEYKANRKGSDDVRPQIKPMKKLLRYMGISVWGEHGIEGDDMSGSLATRAAKLGALSVITSSDKDFLQLVRDGRIHILPPKTEEHMGSEHVRERLGVEPKQVIEYLMLLGDGVDNIPGVYRIGPKTAAKLVAKYGKVSSIVRSADSLSAALRTNLLEAAPKFELTRDLLTIRTDFTEGVTLSDLEFKGVQEEKLRRFCKKLGMHETYNRILKELG